MRPTLESLMQGALNRDRRSPKAPCPKREALRLACLDFAETYGPLAGACFTAALFRVAISPTPANDTDAKARANKHFRRLPADGRVR